MTYATNILKDNVEVNYLIRFGCRFQFDVSWTNVTGTSIYYTAWDDRPVDYVRFTVSDVVKPWTVRAASSYSAMSSTITGMQFYGLFNDTKEKRLYLFLTGGDNPGDAGVEIFGQRMYFVSTDHIGAPFNPDNSLYPDVQYQGILRGVPEITSSTSDLIYGFVPLQSGSITITNENDYLSGEFFDGSISNCVFEIYRVVGEFFPENTQLAFRGFTRNVSYQGDDVTIGYVDASLLLDGNQVPGSKFGSTAQPNVAGLYARSFACGTFTNMLGAVNTLYSDTKANTNNRFWYFGGRWAPNQGTLGNNQLAKYETTDASVGSNTTTRTYLDSLTALSVGTWLIKNSTTTATYEVTAIGANYIDHTALAAPLGISDYFQKTKVQQVTIFQKSNATAYDVPYSEINTNNDTQAAVSFNTTLEATLGISALHPEDHIVYAYCEFGIGRCAFPSTAAALGTRNSTTNYYDNPVQFIYEILFQAGFYDNEDYYDTDSFEAVATDIESEIRIAAAMPRYLAADSRQSFREILAKVCETCLLKVFMKNGKWFVSRIAPLGAADHTVTVESVREGKSYRIVSEEIVEETIVKYNYGDVNDINEEKEHFNYVSSDNIVSEPLHNNTKTLTLELYLDDETIAQLVCDRYNYLFSYPVGTLTLEFDLSKINIDLSQVVEISIDGFEGLPFTTDKKFAVSEIREKADSISVDLFDQRGIEENSGSW
jgi:hypothetical protein